MKKKRFSVEHITAVLQAGHQRCAALRQLMREMAQTRVRFGYRRLRVLMVREGWEVGKERLYRVYIEELLALRRKRPWRHASGVHREQRRPATDRNDIWSMDFVSDELADGRRFRALTVIDLDFSRRGKPTDTATIESFNGRFREECLNVHWFASRRSRTPSRRSMRFGGTTMSITSASSQGSQPERIRGRDARNGRQLTLRVNRKREAPHRDVCALEPSDCEPR